MNYWLKVFVLVGMFAALCVKGASMLSASGVHAMPGQGHAQSLKDPSPAKLLSPDPSSPSTAAENAQKLVASRGTGRADLVEAVPMGGKTVKPKTNVRKNFAVSAKPSTKNVVKKK